MDIILATDLGIIPVELQKSYRLLAAGWLTYVIGRRNRLLLKNASEDFKDEDMRIARALYIIKTRDGTVEASVCSSYLAMYRQCLREQLIQKGYSI